MPVPKPFANENESDFMGRCITFIENEGTEHEQAIAICSTQWNNRNKNEMKNNLQFKSFDILETKDENDGRLRISGYGAVFGNIDSYGDIIERGAFAKTLIDRAGRIAFCLQHDIWNPVAKIEVIEEREKGLWVEALISAAEDDIQTKIKEGILKEMSIGYRTINSRSEVRNAQDVNILSEIKLFEISLVTVAANPLAVVESMKSETDRNNYLEKEFDRLIAIVKNDNINFELQKLKAISISVLAQTEKTEPPKVEEQLKADDILKLLNS